MKFRSRRMILRTATGRVEAVRAIEDLGGFSHSKVSDPGVRTVETFTAGGDVRFDLADDFASACRYVQVHANSQDAALETSEKIEESLEPWSYERLLHFYKHQSGDEHRAEAVIRLALGAPPAFDEEFFSLIAECLESANAEVREAGLKAVGYYSMSRFSPYLQHIHQNDPAENLRETAAIILEIYEERGLKS